ncbi:unnamed protein product, partial [marine sediment metagenome]
MLLSKAVVKNIGSAELLGKFEAQATVDLLSKVVIEHPAFPVWLKGIFSIRLTNAYRDLGSSLKIVRSAFAELFGKFEAQATAELLGKFEVQQSGSAELLGKAVIRHVGTPIELLGKADIKGLSSANLKASVKIRPMTKDSDTYFSLWDPSDWINEVVGIGQGFITIPWVEADADVKTCGNSSARLTSTYAPNQYKEIRFGWGGMNWGVEAAVPPEVAPTPIDTDGRGPRRGSRASRDRRREVLPSSDKDLPAGFFVRRQGFNDLKAQFYVDMAILPGGLWDYQTVWQTSPTAAFEFGTLHGQIEIDPATGAITARQRYENKDETIVTMCGGYRAYSKGTFTFNAEASAYGGGNPVYSPAFGLVENKYDYFAGWPVHAAMLYWDGANWQFYTDNGSGIGKETTLTGDFTASQTFEIIWEPGRVQLSIGGVPKAD